MFRQKSQTVGKFAGFLRLVSTQSDGYSSEIEHLISEKDAGDMPVIQKETSIPSLYFSREQSSNSPSHSPTTTANVMFDTFFTECHSNDLRLGLLRTPTTRKPTGR